MANAKHIRICQRCGKEYAPTLNVNGIPRKTKYNVCSSACRQGVIEGKKVAHRVKMATCKGCNKEFRPRKTEFSSYCSRECSFKHKRVNEIIKTDWSSKCNIGCQQRRKQRIKKNGYQYINKTKVFERDRWICHICGCNTPKRKRGTMSMDAPELDHIVPIAAGGSHTYSNVACACKKCNIKKSSKPLGQLNLGFI